MLTPHRRSSLMALIGMFVLLVLASNLPADPTLADPRRPKRTPKSSFTSTATPTSTSTPTPTATSTPTPTQTATPSATPTPRSTPTPPDTQPPTVTWIAPVGDRQVYAASHGTVELEVRATDNVGVRQVRFYRWDVIKGQYVLISTLTAPPYKTPLAVNTLNMGWNQVNAEAVDGAGNRNPEQKLIWIKRFSQTWLPLMTHP